jgi:hypothetical protein
MFEQEGRLTDALYWYSESLRIDPGYILAQSGYERIASQSQAQAPLSPYTILYAMLAALGVVRMYLIRK